MLRLQNHLRFALRAGSQLHESSLHRTLLLSTAVATSTPPAQFVAADYLVASFGLEPAQALEASKYHLSCLKSPAKPDAVRAFLADAGLADSDIAAAVAMDPRFLCSSVDKTLAPRVAQLRDIGLSTPQISRLVALLPVIFLQPARIPVLEFLISLFGSYDKVEPALKRKHYLLNYSLEKVVKPNIEFLQQCGLSACEIAKLHGGAGRLLIMEPDHVKEMVARAEKLGVRRYSGMFKNALETVCNIRPENITSKMACLERALGRSEAVLAVCKLPSILTMSEGRLSHKLEFLRMKFGLEPSYIAHRPAILAYDFKKRVLPRHYVIEVLKANDLMKKDIDFYSVYAYTDKRFVEKYIDRYSERVLGLADTYTAACAGKIPEIQP